nr:transposase [Streptomyces coryli]
MGAHCGLSRVVENFCLETVGKKWAQRQAEETYGITGDDLTKVPWSAPALEREWRAAHPKRYPWFSETRMSSRVPKEACRVRAAGFGNYFNSKKYRRKGARVGFPTWRKRKHGSRFRYDADRAKPLGPRVVRLPAIGDVSTREDMSWLVDRLATGQARILGATVRERGGRWWISFQIDIAQDDINKRRQVAADAPTCGIDLGLRTFAVISSSDGSTEEIHAPKPLKAAQRALKRANRTLARTAEGSKNRAKARRRVGLLHLRIADRRRDLLHQTTTRLTRTKSAIAASGRPIAGSPPARHAPAVATSTEPWPWPTAPGNAPSAELCTTGITTRQETSSRRCSPTAVPRAKPSPGSSPERQNASWRPREPALPGVGSGR